MTDIAGPGHNNPPPDPFEAWTAHIEDLKLEARNWLDGAALENQSQADEVARLMTGLRAAAKDADKARAEEKKPFDDGAKAVQAKWRPLLDGVDLYVDTCKKTLQPWLLKVEAEQRAKAEAARAEAEAKQAEALAALRASDVTNLEEREAAEQMLKDAERADRAASKEEKARPLATGMDGRSAGLRTRYRAVVMDPVLCARHYWKADPRACEAFFQSLVDADVRAGKRQIPGCDVIEEQVVV